MVNGINSDISRMQALRAINAFKHDAKVVQKAKGTQLEQTQEMPAEEIQQDDNKLQQLVLKKMSEKNVNEIKDFAKELNQDISYEDINYGLTYGRSVLVDYSA